ncbi:TRAP transporter small permease [Hoeflea ulvae]|uniref:TRAP transporter small permease protein n=1 Tax=Hoeflea ulvae TaxID=2983764 RepID=A0ABT3YC45_9HYPH|nr:TRAP transporter small permease subunit [Hoeflea ulvae]MCY0093455.1 TRAP transporter small permease subunit [Hoeflea ulvae]
MQKMLLAICRMISWVQLVLLLTMLGVMASLVLTRYVFSYSPPWSEELTRFAMIWLVMLGGAVLSLFDDHITLTVFSDNFSPRFRILRNFAVRIIMIATSAVIVFKGIKFADGMSAVFAWGLQIHMGIPAYSVVVGFGLILLFNLVLLLSETMALFGIKTDLIPRQDQVMDGSFRTQDDL